MLNKSGLVPKLGFTLIELLVVITLIAILTGIATISYTGIQARGRDSQRKNDLSQIKIALSSYYSAQSPNEYVRSSADNPPALITINGSTDSLSTALEPNYIKEVPVDPVNTGNYVYRYQSFLTSNLNQDFQLFGTLENTNDKKGWGLPMGTGWVINGYVLQNE